MISAAHIIFCQLPVFYASSLLLRNSHGGTYSYYCCKKTLSKSLELVQFFAITLGDLLEKIHTYDVRSNRVPSIRNGAIARFYGIMRRRVSKTNCYPVLGKTN